MKRILITGSNSWIGNCFEAYLKKWPEAYQVQKISVRDEQWRDMSFVGFDAVFHVAAIVHQEKMKNDPNCAQLYDRVNAVLPVEIARKAKAEGVGQFLFISTFSVYGIEYSLGAPVVISEKTPLTPNDLYGESKLKAERGLEALESDTFRVAILRPPVVYGKGCKGNYTSLQKYARLLPVFPKVDNRRFMLYIDNFSELVRRIIDRGDRGIFCPQNREMANVCQMVQWIGQEHGRKVYAMPGLLWLIRLLYPLTPRIGKGFATIYYDEALSYYPEDYCVVSLRESVTLSEH